MTIKHYISNNLSQKNSKVWSLENHTLFNYSDGEDSENYLYEVMSNSQNLSNGSPELEGKIKDWPSEYHLTSKRGQLLSGFDFDSNQLVLEVGCGCGAITRYLGETFTRVISIEGSLRRAEIAGSRVNNLDNVDIVCAPFQELKFKKQFDLILCIGVLEYSGSFISSENPYDSCVEYFSRLLKNDGTLIIAIENQFGLKYMNGCNEDHLGRKFIGVEGYYQDPKKVKTFGKKEIESKLKRNFHKIEFYYPYPDYKLPDAVLSNNFINRKSAGELLTQIESRDYHDIFKVSGKLFDDKLVILELAKNNNISFFSNSFLIFANKSNLSRHEFKQSAILFSHSRNNKIRTKTRIIINDNEIGFAEKTLKNNKEVETIGKLRVKQCKSEWINNHSLYTELYKSIHNQGVAFESNFIICKPWIKYLKENSQLIDNIEFLNGKFIDTTLQNVYLVDGKIKVIDQELEWENKIKLKTIILRSFYIFIHRNMRCKAIKKQIVRNNIANLLLKITSQLDLNINKKDILEFINLESELSQEVSGGASSKNKVYVHLKYYLFLTLPYLLVKHIKNKSSFIILILSGKIKQKMNKILNKAA